MIKSVQKRKLSGHKKNISIIVSKFNQFITKNLLEACLQTLFKNGVKQNDVNVVWVPGSFEIPVVALKEAKKKNVDAVICLGCVIRGETYHFEVISQSAAYGIQQAALLTGKPVIFGVLTTETIDQAYKRSQVKGDNKGRDAALAAIEMI